MWAGRISSAWHHGDARARTAEGTGGCSQYGMTIRKDKGQLHKRHANANAGEGGREREARYVCA